MTKIRAPKYTPVNDEKTRRWYIRYCNDALFGYSNCILHLTKICHHTQNNYLLELSQQPLIIVSSRCLIDDKVPRILRIHQKPLILLIPLGMGPVFPLSHEVNQVISLGISIDEAYDELINYWSQAGSDHPGSSRLPYSERNQIAAKIDALVRQMDRVKARLLEQAERFRRP